jgi:uncharacterized protein
MKESRYNIWVERGDAVYVYNGVSGALLRVPQEERLALQRFLTGEPDASCRPALLTELARGRMLIPDDGDELSMLARVYRASRFDTSQLGLTIVTSLGCNFDCPYCFEAKHPSIMNEEVEAAVLQLVEDKLPTIGALHVNWFGGEPLVGKRPLLELSEAFVARCDRSGVAYSAQITTNGYLLDQPTCVALRERRVDEVQVCLDGPPAVHDRMRPLAGGKGTFWRIVENLHHAVEHFRVAVRVNVSSENFVHAEKLLEILAGENLAGKLSVYAGHIVAVNDGAPSPSATYPARCFNNREFAEAEQEFTRLAVRHGFATRSLPRPAGAPCTAVRANELVIGSEGELYKCWDSVGNPREVVGNIRDYRNPNGRLQKWLKYDPFANDECRSCIALPVCMGGCAHHAMDLLQYENRCGTFRHTYRDQVLAFVEAAETSGASQATSRPLPHA